MAKWTLTDNSTGSPVIYTFPINPNEFDPPGRTSTVQSEQTTAPNGQHIVFQGRDVVSRGSFSGLVNSETFHDSLEVESDKFYVLTLTDDQASTWDILTTNFSWTRVRRASNQWRYDYTWEFMEIG